MTEDESSKPLTPEQKALIQGNYERAKRRRLERFLEEFEKQAEQDDDDRQGEKRKELVEQGAGGFIPEDLPEEQIPIIRQPEILFPLEMNERCKVCGSVELDDSIRRSYKALVCPRCREALPDRFGLITKTAAKDEFLLTDEELRDGSRLPHTTKPNPLKPTWSNMQLFLREQVLAFALEKWGGLEQIQEEAQRRANAHQSAKEKKFAANLMELRRKTRLTGSRSKQPSSRHHKHSFVERKEKDGSQVESVCSECGFKVVSEEL